MNQEVLKSVEKSGRQLEMHGSNLCNVTQQSGAQMGIATNSNSALKTAAHLANDSSSATLTDIETVARKLEHITDLLTETRMSSSLTSTPSTVETTSDVSSIVGIDSSRETTRSSISDSGTVPNSAAQKAQRPDINEEHPLLQFKDNNVRLHTYKLLLG